MDFNDVLYQRRSIRAFSDRPVAPETLDALLADALASPSWSNTQPYRVAVATGEQVERLRRVLSERFARVATLQRAPAWKKLVAAVRGGVLPDGDFKPILKYPADLQPRRVATGHGLYQTLGIARNDHAARDAQMARNFSFFDAPVAMFIFAHKGLGAYSALDAGIFLQSLMLSATNRGLGTCAQGALALWRSPVEAEFEIPKDYQLLCGLSLGYPADEVVNTYRPDRRTLDELVLSNRT